MENSDPFDVFDSWYTEARTTEINDSNAVALATTGADGQPSVRMVLLKGHGRELGTHGGFIFYTNFESRKAMQLSQNAQVALLFHWKSLRRQVRIEGQATPVDNVTADAYFATRSRNSQLGAWASDQSRPLADRATFEARFAQVENRFDGIAVPRPPHWSGWMVTPTRIEFWQDREFRLHERWVHERTGETWNAGMLYP
ncbi:MAG: pyridoxamine 5'-phosphate oxidase [Sphingorhabdus sp.]